MSGTSGPRAPIDLATIQELEAELVRRGGVPPSVTQGTAKKRMTPDEIEAEIHSLAQSGEGVDRRWALGKIGAASQGITIPPPKTEEEIQHRVVRILKGVGRTSSYRCLRIAFPADSTRTDSQLEEKVEEAAKEEARPIRPPTNLNALYRMFPELAKDRFGYPPGWETVEKKSAMKKRAFIMDLAHQANNARKAREQGKHVEEVE